MTSPAYSTVVLGADDAWVNEVVTQLNQFVTKILGRSGLVEFSTQLPPEAELAQPRPFAVVVFLADENSRNEPLLLQQLDAAWEQCLPVLPVVWPDADVFATLPPSINAA